ncbi:MAG: LLM class F420-dependent oxidoreductase [Acidimicrobiales bacterium]|jgi:F420-dependent oxidoreductase-like protein|nr:LLM class F420-dependent oxidoreductase [Acidimicrobiales bacterium]MDP6298310.1 LLM class F420-dependent oxidoreductase [Acidimicrobiales bacterium]HJM28126.1 LLM class F420-dependent oxidoreductase [Acidimicrobiales bacterium]HJM96571.1 LLM class F420-dependent oxidoreductase [Acidimicrobiales bacterium]
MKLGAQYGYWTGQPRQDIISVAVEAERLGFDSLWTGESYSSDAFTPLCWVGSHTKRIKLATGIAQLGARTPAALAMHAMTLDALSEGRFCLGIGVSGPQVIEGWHGQPFGKPVQRTRETIAIIRKILQREDPVTASGPNLPLPYPDDAPNSWGLGKPLKLINTPLRSDIPIFLGAEGPKNIALAFEECDGWLPLYYAPERPEIYELPEANATDEFEIAVNVNVNICEDIPEGLLTQKAILAFYIGGMGAQKRNFHTELMARMGYEKEASEIQSLFLSGKRNEAIMAVPDAFADEISLVGPIERIAERLELWEQSPVTTLIIGANDLETMRTMAELVL